MESNGPVKRGMSLTHAAVPSVPTVQRNANTSGTA